MIKASVFKASVFLGLLLVAVAIAGCGGSDGNDAAAKVEDPHPERHGFHIAPDANPWAGPAPLKVKFSVVPFNQSGDVRYRWRFDDGTETNEQNPTHTFTQGSSYTVIIDALDGNNTPDRVNLVLGVWPPKVWKRGVKGMSRAQILNVQRAQKRRTLKRLRELEKTTGGQGSS